MDVSPTFVQQVFGGFADDAAPTTATAIGGQNVNFTRRGVAWQLRFRIAQTTLSITTGNVVAFKLKHQVNGTGGFTDVPAQGASGTKVRFFNSSNITDNETISVANFRFGTTGGVDGRADENNATGNVTFNTANAVTERTELVFALEWGTTISHGDLIEFRVYTSADVALSTYTVTPTVRYNSTGAPIEVVSSIIAAGGGDFTTPQAWESAVQRDFVAVDEIAAGACQAGSVTGTINFAGSTTDATHYLHLRAASGHEHGGIPGAGFKLTNNTSSTTVTFTNQDVRVSGIEVANTSTGQGIVTASGSTGRQIYIYDCLVGPVGGTGAINMQHESTCFIFNNIVHDATANGIVINGTSVLGHVYNNTVVGGTHGIRRVSGTCRPKNNIAQGASTADFNGTMTDSATNLASDATAEIQATLTFADAANDNYHLDASDTAAIDAGTDLSADGNLAFDWDIDGDERPQGSAWDIGADEAESTAGDAEAFPGTGELEIVGAAPTLAASAQVTPTTASLEITGHAPTFSAQTNFTAEPSTGVLELIGLAPTLAASSVAAPAAGVLAITGLAPTVAAGALLTPDTGALEVTGHAPTFAAHFTAATQAGALELDGFAPTLSASATVTPATGELEITGFAPAVGAGASVDAQPDAGALEIAGLAPTVSASAALTPATGGLEVVGASPTVSAGATLEPDSRAVGLAGHAPTFLAHHTAAPAPGSLVVTGEAPAVSAAASMETAAGAVEITGHAPTFTGTAAGEFAPGAGALTIVGFAPTVSTSNTVETATGAVVVTGYAPAAGGGAGVTLTTQTGSLVVVGHAPTFAGHFTAAANAGNLVLTSFSPGISTGHNIEVPEGSLAITGYEPVIIKFPAPDRRTVQVGARDGEILVDARSQVTVGAADRQFAVSGRRRIRVGPRGGSSAA